MMTIDEQKQANARVIESARPFEAMYTHPDFVEWQKVGPLAEMEKLKTEMATIDRRSTENWRDVVAEKVIEYQAIARVLYITNVHVTNAARSRANLKELETK